MCKLFISAGPITRARALSIISKAATVFGRSQKDGFGFVAYGPAGLAGGRYLVPGQYPGHGVSLPGFVDCVRIESGAVPATVTALIVHGRTATSRVVLGNVHPFEHRGLTLAHNGVLSWIGKGPEPEAPGGCDSEAFLRWFRPLRDPWSETSANWSGYGVFGIMEPAKGRLTVAKCQQGKLSYASTDAGVHLWSTESSDLEAIAGPDITRPMVMRSRTRVTFDVRARKARLMEIRDWPGFGDRVRDDLWSRSMGTGGERKKAWEPVRADGFPDWEPRGLVATSPLPGGRP